MTARVRLLGVVISPQIIIDDGEYLEAREVGTIAVPAARLDEVPLIVREALVGLQAQLDTAVAPEVGNSEPASRP